MHTLTRRSLLLVALAIGAAACAGAAQAGASVNLTAEDASTGFRWVLATQPDPRVLSLTGSEYVEAETELVGVPGQEVWTFLAEREGETELVLRYERSSGETAGEPSELTVLVG